MSEPPLVVLVCGGRDFADRTALYAKMDVLFAEGPLHIITGGARGADSLAIEWADQHNVSWQVYAPEWLKYGRRAGPIRNQRMIDEGKPDLVVAFRGGTGTRDTVQRAQSAGIRIDMV